MLLQVARQRRHPCRGLRGREGLACGGAHAQLLREQRAQRLSISPARRRKR